MEFSLLWAAVLGPAAAYGVLRWATPLIPPGRTPRELWDLLLTAGITGLAAGRLAALVSGGTNPLTDPGDILIIRSGVHTGFASAAALATAGLLARRDLLPTLDALAPAALAGLAGWQAGCLVRGACLGTPTSLPWGITQTGSSIARHPVELYAALLLAIAAMILLLLGRRPPRPGVVAGAALAAAGAARLATEPLRPTLGGGPTVWYMAAIAAGLAMVAAARFVSGSPRNEPTDSAEGQ